MWILEIVKQRALLARITHAHLSRLIFFLLVVLVLVPLLSHHYLSKIGDEGNSGTRINSKPDTFAGDVEKTVKFDLCMHVEELKKIRASVNNELRSLESKRQRLQSELSGYNTNIHRLKNEHEKLQKDLERLKITIETVKLEKEEMMQHNMPVLSAPKQILPNVSDDVYIPPPKYPTMCQMHNCFDYSRCSLTSGFPVYLYNPQKYLIGKHINMDLLMSLQQSKLIKDYATLEPSAACVYMVFIGELRGVRVRSLQMFFSNLPYWRGDGRNHILVSFSRRAVDSELLSRTNTGRAIVVQNTFAQGSFWRDFNIMSPPFIKAWSSSSSWKDMTLMSPIQRKFLLSFAGEHPDAKPASPTVQKTRVDIEPDSDYDDKLSINHSSFNNNNNNIINNNYINNVNKESNNNNIVNNMGPPNHLTRHLNGLLSEKSLMQNLDNMILDILKNIQSLKTDPFSFDFSCKTSVLEKLAIPGEWAYCESENFRRDMVKQSSFTLIIAPMNTSFISTPLLHIRLLEALRFGSIPIILGNYVRLPFAELLDWRKAAIILPKPRITELHFMLRTYTDSSIAEMRRQGRFLWETYFSTLDRVVATILATVRTRLQIPAASAPQAPSPSFLNVTLVQMKLESQDIEPETDDILGPIEPPFPSESFSHNFSQIRTYETFNQHGDPFHSFAATPYEPVLPSEAKFFGSGYGFRPINKGAGGAGKEFSEGLGGNVPREQFTVVMLTYEREAVLVSALQRLKGVPHLNRVVVVWNSPKPPSADLHWPDINVPINVVKTDRNTLNNRFLPFDVIETEAILSIDDDVHLRHDEIIFGFRVWRESRDRVVGFPGRYHGWHVAEKSWHYNASHSCELSMVLTGAAFFHKYYAYMYSYIMPQAIRDKVDDYINCEDIAMNFLVAHLTRKPPIKVTSRWTFRCPGCSQALAKDDTHFEERHKCINFFAKVYGYMPLLYTQFRVDSVLFKTKIPRDKQKCFRFI